VGQAVAVVPAATLVYKLVQEQDRHLMPMLVGKVGLMLTLLIAAAVAVAQVALVDLHIKVQTATAG
jgi:hypothetical protein